MTYIYLESARRASGILTNPTALTQVLDQAIRLGTQQQKRKSTHEEKQDNASKQEENKGFQRIIRNEKAWKALEGYEEKRLGKYSSMDLLVKTNTCIFRLLALFTRVVTAH